MSDQTEAADAGDAVAAADDSSARSFSVTYTAENSVDEYDAVKYDGEYLFIAPSRSMDCCVVLTTQDVAQADQGASAVGEAAPRAIRILRTTPADAGVTEVSEIPLANGFSVEGLYQQQDRLLALTASNWWGAYGDQALQSWVGESTGLQLFDLSDPTNPTDLATVSIEGALITSRKTAAGVHIVSRHSPSMDGFVYYPSSEQDKANNDELLQNLNWEDLLPEVLENDVPLALFNADNCYSIDADHPLAPRQLGYPTVTTVVTINPNTGAVTDGLCYLEYSDGAYFSGEALHLTQTDYDQDSQRHRTYVHRFDLSAGMTYAGSGRIDGALFLGGQSDFRISAAGDNLRLVTTQRTSDSSDSFDHSLYVLQVDATDKQLNTVGQLPNSERPDEIGKPNEDLYGVRFVGNRAYLVTFERTDPLYTIDLADPTDPYIVGELEVTGFSNFLHPVSDDLLLGLGRSADNRVKLELFDVSDFAAPVSRGVLTLGADLSWAYTAAEYDRHAFSYLVGDATDRLAIPLSGYVPTDANGWVARLQLIEVCDKAEADGAALMDAGYLSVQGLGPNEYPDGLSRSVLAGEAVFYINGTNVFSAFWNDPFNQTGPH
ncbi:MAG: beta-propeller domain-containing protein [Pseudomonadota bacterium]|nr:beta-propeller domain-containing protein [Pseudomonadota bacterium]